MKTIDALPAVKKIQLPTVSPESPCYQVIDDFIPPDMARKVYAELSSPDVLARQPDVVTNRQSGSRNTFYLGRPEYGRLLEICPETARLCSYFSSKDFFDAFVISNLDILLSRGLLSGNLKFDPSQNDFQQFFPDTGTRIKNLIRDRLPKKVNALLQRPPRPGGELQAGPTILIAYARKNYYDCIHTDRRYKLPVGLLYLTEVDPKEGGRLGIWKYKTPKDLADCDRLADPAEMELQEGIRSKSGRFVALSNANNDYHGVDLYSGEAPRINIVVTWSVPAFSNIWKTNFPVVQPYDSPKDSYFDFFHPPRPGDFRLSPKT